MDTKLAPYRYRRPVGPRKPALTPIPGSDLQLGDRVWPSPDRVFTVETIGINGPRLPPQMYATGPGRYLVGTEDEFETVTRIPYYGDGWLVVER